MRVFISGGCKNGKSTHAERIAVWLAQRARPLYYVATMLPADDEDAARIARHRRSREGYGFETVELVRDVVRLKDICDTGGVFLLDSTTALLSNEMFLPGGEINLSAGAKIADELSEVIGAVRNMVIVSDYIYSDAAVYDEYTDGYRKGLALIDRRCARFCDVVLEACYGNLMAYKGGELLGGIYGQSV